MTAHRAAVLRRAIAAHAPKRGKRYDVALKSRIVAFAQDLRSRGWSFARIAHALGLPLESVRRWCMSSRPQKAQMRSVEIVAEQSTEAIVAVSRSVSGSDTVLNVKSRHRVI